MKLTKYERLNLVNQLLILEALYPDEAEYFAKRREIYENGFELMYDIDMDHIYDDEYVMSEEECREVWDTMDMFESIDRSIKNLNMRHEDFEGMTKFRGYDGNNETKFFGFAEFTVQKDRRFTYLPLQVEGEFNSHAPVRDNYSKMLVAYQEIPQTNRYEMNKETLDAILGEVNQSRRD